MKRLNFVVSIAAAVVLMAGTAMAVPFSTNVANDVYGVTQGGTVNGIPTAQDNNDNAGGVPPFAPDINDAINQILGTTYGRNKDVDHLFVEPDYVWTMQAGAGIALIGLTAGFNNSVGVYTDLGVGNVTTHVIGPHSGFGFAGDGTAANPYPAAGINLAAGTQFGWYLDANTQGTTYYYSEPAISNTWDHMMTFRLPFDAQHSSIWIEDANGVKSVWHFNNPHLIAWEDLPYNATSGQLGDDDYDDMMYVIDNVARPPIPEPGTMFLLGGGLLGLIGFGRRRSSPRYHSPSA